jgi:hypothetical protein
MHADFEPARNAPNSSRAALFLEQRIVVRCNFRHFSVSLEPVAATGVCYRGTARADKMQVSIRHFPQPSRRDFK